MPGYLTPEVPEPPPGWCEPHWHDPGDGDGDEEEVPLAAYVWTFASGKEMEMCVDCCAAFREGCAEDPDLEPPSRIRSL